MRKKESILFMLLSLLLTGTGTESERDICRWVPFLLELSMPPTLPPRADSALEFAIGVTGSDDVCFILGVKIPVSDNDLEIEGFFRGIDEASGAGVAAFSISKVEIRDLKLSLGNKLFKDDLPFDEEGAGEPPALASTELGVRRKFTFLGDGLGVGGILITTESREESSNVLEGISRKRFLRFQC